LLRLLGTACLCASSVAGGCGIDTAPETSRDAGVDAGASSSSDDAETGVSCSLEPPPRPTGALSKPTPGSHDYAIHEVFLGDTDRMDNPSPVAWQSYGYDLDHKLTTVSSTDVCTLTPGTSTQVQVDGDCGTDNSWGANVLPLIAQLDDTGPGWATPEWTEMMYVTGFDDAMGNTTSAVGLTGVLLAGTLWQDGLPSWDPSTVWPVAPESVSGCTAAGGCPAGTNPLGWGFHRGRANQLLVHELLDAHVAELAPVAGVLDAAEGQLRVRPGDVVDEHHARLDAARHPLAAGDVLREDRAAEAEVGVVGERDRRVLVLDPEEERHRAEELLLGTPGCPA
jgi:hypothetical protein